MDTKALVVGAGVIGLAVAERLSRLTSTLILERHPKYGQETSSRNSEVIHAGLYYPGNTHKLAMCIRGKAMLYERARRRNIPHRQIGKWIVGDTDGQLQYLLKLARDAQANKVPIHFASAQERAQEPHVKAKHVLVSPSTGIIDSHALMDDLLFSIEDSGGQLVFNTHVTHIERIPLGYRVHTSHGSITAQVVVNAGGLAAGSIANMVLPREKHFTLHYCKGHYVGYNGKSLVSRLVYPTPEANLTGLGIHATLDLAGKLKFGPDTLYIDRPDDYALPQGPAADALLDRFHERITTYLPDVQRSDLFLDYTGIRPKLAGPGEKFRDFIIREESSHGLPAWFNLVGIESPGLTSSLAIAEHVESLIQDHL